MKNYSFEYSDTKYTKKLLGLSFLTFILLLIAMIVTVDILGIIGSIILAMGVPTLIFFLNKKKIKKQGSASIHETYAEFQLANSTQRLDYADIKTYQVERFNGTSLKVRFKDKKTFHLQSNDNFGNPERFDELCNDFDRIVQSFISSNDVEITRKKSMFDQKWILPFLIILTGGLIAGFIFVLSSGKKIPPTFYTSLAIIIPLWIGYFNARNRKRNESNING